MSVAEAAEV